MNKKGFTLIELLAVIVILAIIALIATPIVMNVIDNAQDGANKRSVESYMKSVETAYYEHMLNNGGATPTTAQAQSAAEYNGTEVTCANIGFAENTKEFTATGCKVGTDSRTYSYNNGKAENANAQ